MTIVASSTSWCWRASSARSSCSTTRSRAPSALSSSMASSAWKLWRWSCAIALAELPGDVLLRAGVVGRGEDLVGRPVLDDLALEQERRRVGHARGLLHVVRDYDDRDAVL